MNHPLQYIQKTRVLRGSILKRLSDLNPDLAELDASLVKNVLIILSQPRSGSSLLYHLLTQSQHFYFYEGELIPFYRLNSKNQPMIDEKGDASHLYNFQFEAFRHDFLINTFNANILSSLNNQHVKNNYSLYLFLKLSFQWPNINFDIEKTNAIIMHTIDVYQKNNSVFNLNKFYINLFKQLISVYSEINPYYYDIDVNLLKQNFPGIAIPNGPPNSYFLLEEPPFVLLPPRRNVTVTDLQHKTLLLKSSIDLYRLDLIHSLFPQANFKYLFLFRDPAASINGLYDGWLHRGFFSHNLQYFLQENSRDNQLRIDGYSNKFNFGKYWWNYDLPPGWIGYIKKSLEEICAFQWQSSVTQSLKILEGCQVPFAVINYENLITNNITRMAEFQKIFSLIKNDNDLQINYFPLIQVTELPRRDRWLSRKELIQSVLSKEIKEINAYIKNKQQIEVC